VRGAGGRVRGAGGRVGGAGGRVSTVVLCTVNSLTFVEVWRHPSSTECTRGMTSVHGE
jgi:hypothetical protein